MNAPDVRAPETPPDRPSTRTVLITGGAGEIGTRLGSRYVAEGAAVRLVDLSPTVLDRATAIGATGHRIDVTDPDALAELSSIQRIDVLINGVGVWPLSSVDDLTPARWRQFIDINLNSAYFTTWACRDALRAAGGAVVNIASAIAFKGHGEMAYYAAAKAGVIGMTRALALSFGPDRVRVNAVAPGLVATPAARATWGAERVRAFRASRALDIDIEIDDVVDAIMFLASRSSRAITGQTLVVDGGTVFH